MEITYRKVGELVPYINNARTHSDGQVAQICASIREYGWTNPVLIDENGMIIAGHGRVMAAQRMKMDEVPCIVLSGLTEAQKKAYVIADNKMALNAGWDDEKLKLELENLKELDFNLELTGFDSDELDQLLSLDDIEELPDDIDDVPEPPKEAKSKLGDIYKLGEHTLMCGDSTKKEDVESLVGGGNKVDLVFTDPPYGVSAMGGRGQTKKKLGMKPIANDELRKTDLTEFLSDFISIMPCKENSSIYICYPWSRQKEFTDAIMMNGLDIRNCIIWDKKVFGLNGFGYRPQYEMIYFCSKGDFKWYGGKSQSNVWQINREIKRGEQGNHPTPKPIELIARALINSSRQGDIVLDLFGGSGSTLIACEQLKRKCFMMEFDPVYCDVIIERWERFTGRKAVKVNG